MKLDSHPLIVSTFVMVVVLAACVPQNESPTPVSPRVTKSPGRIRNPPHSQQPLAARSDPREANALPPLLNKLQYEKEECLNWAFRSEFPDGDNLSIEYQDSQGGRNRTRTGAPVKPGGLFFADGVMCNRFKYLRMERRLEMDKRINLQVEVFEAVIEDEMPGKMGKVYKIPRRAEGLALTFHAFDRSAVLSFESTRQTIKENIPFGLPFSNPKKNYLLKKVTPDEIEVEYTDPTAGTKKTTSIRKAAKAPANPPASQPAGLPLKGPFNEGFVIPGE